ncbi:MAG: apolipoprotein N-acyltransferase [Kiritimatiellae bacterium]|nr:apolipoprotein N-acyltransferase [Kiritimatiellia bacterium]
MTQEKWMRVLKGAAGVASGLLLWAAFPPQAQAESAWLALAPLFLVIRHSTPKGAFGWAWLSGLVFWVLTLSWFPAIIKNEGPWPLVILGQVALSAWCAVFLAVYAYASARVWRWAGTASGWRRVTAVVVLDPLMWAGTEVARGWLFSGFAWNFLGVSQVANLPLIQVASVTGVYGVSALLVLANGAVAGMLERSAAPFIARLTRQPCGTPSFAARLLRSAESLLPFALVIGCWAWGVGRVNGWKRAEGQAAVWRVALVQPNSPCIFTLNSDTVRSQLDLLVNQTRLAGAARPDVVVWPETAVLGSVPDQPQTMKMIRDGAAAAGAPLLTGTLETEPAAVTASAPEGLLFYNAAWLFSASGETLGRYRKRHLVPFGEYIPLDKTFPFLQRLAPTGVSCTPGNGPGILKVTRRAGEVLTLGPMICFEDTVPSLSREAVRAGARLLVLMTNDAWFNGSIEPLQHLNQSVFRAVENGVPLVRAANSGVSCAVDAVGRVKRLESNGAVSDFSGFLVTQVAVPGEPLASPYTRWGDWLLGFPGLAAVLATAVCGLAMDRRGRR